MTSGVAELPRGQARVRARESDPGLSFPFPTSAETAADVFQGHSPRLHRPASLGPPSTTPFLFLLFSSVTLAVLLRTPLSFLTLLPCRFTLRARFAYTY